MDEDPTRHFEQLFLSTGTASLYLRTLGSHNGKSTKEYLWSPPPDMVSGEIQVGDVGIIVQGSFRSLWSISKPFSSNVDPNFMKQAGSPQMPPFDPTSDVESHPNYMLPYVPHCSKGVTQRPTSSGVPTKRPESFHFIANKVREGAVVIPFAPVERTCMKADVRKRWETVLERNAKVWRKYAFAKAYSIDELILVTGCVKTSKWLIVTFRGHGEFRLDIDSFGAQFIGVPSIRGEVQAYISEPLFTEELDRLRIAAYGAPLPPPPVDQCLAIEGRRFGKRDFRKIQNNIKAHAEPREPSPERDDSGPIAILCQ